LTPEVPGLLSLPVFPVVRVAREVRVVQEDLLRFDCP